MSEMAGGGSEGGAGSRVSTWLAPTGLLRLRIARTTAVVDEAVRRHALGMYATVAIGRALTAAALIPMTWKDADRVAVQWTGIGPLGSLVAEVRKGGALRGYVGHPDAAPPRPFRRTPRPRTVGYDSRGLLVVTRQAETGVHAQSQVRLHDGSIDGDLEDWFTASEQVPTRLRVDEREDDGARSVVGVLAQALPGSRGQPADPELLPDLDALLALTDLDDDALVATLAPGARQLEVQPLRFACPCSRDRMAAGIAMLAADELEAMIQEDRGAEVRCQFCADEQRFSEDDLRAIIARKEAAATASGGDA